jgi:hypothetical protein
LDRWIAQQEVAAQTGIVVPAFFSAKPSDDMVRQLLWMTLADTPHYVPLPRTWVVVDGDPRTERLVLELQQQFTRTQGATFACLALPENRGKLGALAAGITALLAAEPAVQFVVVRDGDGDHDLADVPGLVRLALGLAEAYGHGRVMAVGARRSRAHPMGWVRGELEELLDLVTLDALTYHLAREGRALNLGHCLGGGHVPDLSSGFKVYGRELAEALFVQAAPRYATLSPSDYWHYGPETVTFVEATLAGAMLAEKLRLTWDGQPATSFGEFQQVALYGELLAWVWARLALPVDVAARHYDNHAPRLALRTVAQGRKLVGQVRGAALARLLAYHGQAGEPPAPAPFPAFV